MKYVYQPYPSQLLLTSPLSPVGGWYAIRATNPIASTYLRAPNASAITGAEVTWADPMDDMILMAHELAFRTALTTSSEVPGTATMGADYNFYNLTTEQPYIISPNLTEVNRTISQSALVKESRIVTVYATQKGWLAGGFVVICLAILAIVPTYWVSRRLLPLPRNRVLTENVRAGGASAVK